jgi:hypothetical protein
LVLDAVVARRFVRSLVSKAVEVFDAESVGAKDERQYDHVKQSELGAVVADRAERLQRAR